MLISAAALLSDTNRHPSGAQLTGTIPLRSSSLSGYSRSKCPPMAAVTRLKLTSAFALASDESSYLPALMTRTEPPRTASVSSTFSRNGRLARHHTRSPEPRTKQDSNDSDGASETPGGRGSLRMTVLGSASTAADSLQPCGSPSVMTHFSKLHDPSLSTVTIACVSKFSLPSLVGARRNA